MKPENKPCMSSDSCGHTYSKNQLDQIGQLIHHYSLSPHLRDHLQELMQSALEHKACFGLEEYAGRLAYFGQQAQSVGQIVELLGRIEEIINPSE